MLDLIRPNSGSIRVVGIDPQSNPVAVRTRVGYLPGELRLDDNLTAEAIFRNLGSLRGGSIDWGSVRQMSERLDLALRRPVKQFSKGNKQKVGVVQALMHRPQLLMLDEPTSGLDPLVQQEVLSLIREARAGGATVFFSSHNLSEVQHISDRVGIIRSGKIVEVSQTASLINRAIRRATVYFSRPADASGLAAIPGITLLGRDDMSVQLQIEGEMDALIKALASYPVSDFETERPSLEEVFLTYYEAGPVEVAER
jgi:ABC-2 type transport system ATP-binding protein